MLFEPHEKQVYTPPDTNKKFDPLAVDRGLRLLTNGRLDSLLTDWQAINDDKGDVSLSPCDRSVISAEAEQALVTAARKVFNLPDFPESSDALALEWLCDYLRWMEGKGKRGG